MKLINLTPHALNILQKNGEYLILPPSGQIARVRINSFSTGEIEGIEISYNEYEGMSIPVISPKTERGIVSGQFLTALKERFPEMSRFFYSPGELIRNDAGQPIGCKGLVK